MKHEADYEDGAGYQDDTIVFQTGYQPSPMSRAIAHWRGQTSTERIDAELDELRRRVAALEALARYNHDQ